MKKKAEMQSAEKVIIYDINFSIIDKPDTEFYKFIPVHSILLCLSCVFCMALWLKRTPISEPEMAQAEIPVLVLIVGAVWLNNCPTTQDPLQLFSAL